MFLDNVNESYTAAYDPEVAPSPYTLGVEGALMHVYESQCNYNALIEAAGIAEYKYAVETGGGDLFVNEAGAFANFVSRAKEMFKKIVEKIKAIFNKLGMVLAQFTKTDKEFVNKYGKQLRRVNMRDFEFKGYKFTGLDAELNRSDVDILAAYNAVKTDKIDKISEASTWDKFAKGITDQTVKDPDSDFYVFADSDAVKDAKEKVRAEFAPKGISKPTSYESISELLEDWKETIYGSAEKETIDDSDINMITQLTYIEKTNENTKLVTKFEKKTIKEINRIIKLFENVEKEAVKLPKPGDDKDDKNRRVASRNINDMISIMHSASSDVTAVCGCIAQAVKDRNRQAKAICIKAINYKPKNESVDYSVGGYDGDDLFGSVNLR